MRLPQVVLFLLTFFTAIHAFAIPSFSDISASSQDLFKRKGGGGGKGGSGSSSSGSSSSGSSGSSSSGSSSSGSSSSGSSSSGSSSSGSSSSGSSSSGSSSSGSRGSGSSGSTSTSGAPRSYGGGQYYGGGATRPYRSGSNLPSGLPAAGLLLGGAAALTVFSAGAFAYGAYSYPYNHPWTYYNQTSNTNDTLPVDCVCARYQQCGCDDSNVDQNYINSVANNNTIAKVADINGKQTLVVDGTLSNDTSVTDTSAGIRVSSGSSAWLAVAAGVSLATFLM